MTDTRFVDLSAPIGNSPPGVPELFRTEIDYQDHAAGAETIEGMLDVPRRLPRDGEGWANEPLDLVLVRTGRDEHYRELDCVARLACFPLRIAGAGAAPARVVSLLPHGGVA